MVSGFRHDTDLAGTGTETGTETAIDTATEPGPETATETGTETGIATAIETGIDLPDGGPHGRDTQRRQLRQWAGGCAAAGGAGTAKASVGSNERRGRGDTEHRRHVGAHDGMLP